MHVLNVEKNLRVLAIAPHADDIELGCGATLLWLHQCRNATLFYRLLSGSQQRANESQKAAAMLGVKMEHDRRGSDAVAFDAREFGDMCFPEERGSIHRYLEATKESIDPHLVLAPSTDDMHQDHVTIAETVRRVFREGQAVWHYEIHQFYSSSFVPNFYVDVSGDCDCGTDGQMSFAARKCDILDKCFESQKGTMYLDKEVLLGNMRARGQQCSRSSVKYAEAFQARVSVFDFQGYESQKAVGL